ncbi:MAG: glycosyltransferase family 2 protein [Thermodesulfobacteriota bacterium]|nr:glycosyltransferase family 2 protein [Thermodesulfobacteriota bacterium]
MTSRPDISFLICAFNRLELTKQCLQSLTSTVNGFRYEVILVDDASTDGTTEYFRSLPPPYVPIINSRRKGFAANNNTAARHARGEVLCLLNNDTILTPLWLEPMRDAFRLFERIGIVGNIHIAPQTGRFDHFGVSFFKDGSADHCGRHSVYKPRNEYSKWPAVTAACCMIKRELFLAFGGFDEGFRNSHEDVDLCLRMGRGGYEHYVANRSVIYHLVGATEGRRLHELENHRRHLERWLPTAQNLSKITPCPRYEWSCNYLQTYLRRPWRLRPKRLFCAMFIFLGFRIQKGVYGLFMARANLFPKRFLPKRFFRVLRNMELQEEWFRKHRLKGDLQDDGKEQRGPGAMEVRRGER